MRAAVLLVAASLLVIGAFACGSTRPPIAELTPADAGDRSDGSGADASNASGEVPGTTCYDESQVRPSEDCKCTLPVGPGLTVDLPCGYAVCAPATGPEAICTNIATIIYVSGCPPFDPDASAGAPGSFRLPLCDAGADAAMQPDAATDAEAGTD